jgi:hypothetical protein
MADKKISALTSATTPLAGTEVLPIVQSNTTVKVSAANITAGRAVSTLSVNSTGPNGIPITLQEITTLPSSALAAYVGVTTSAFPGGANGDVVIIPRTSGANDVRVYVGSGTPTEAVVVQGSTKDLRIGSGNIVPATAAKGINFTANTPLAGMTSQLLNWYEEGSWTPTWNGGSITTVVIAKYVRVGKLIHCVIGVVLGSSSGSGASYITLPWAGVTNYVGGGSIGYYTGDPTPYLYVPADSAVFTLRPNAYSGGYTQAQMANQTLYCSLSYIAA